MKPKTFGNFSSGLRCCQKTDAPPTSRKLHIGAVAKLTGLSIDTIRFYEKKNLLKTPPRSLGGYRLYGPGEIRALRFITKAQKLGFSLREIGKLLDSQHDPGECATIAGVIEEKLAQVRAKMKHLIEIESCLEISLGKCNRALQEMHRPPQRCPVLDDLAS